MYRTATAPITEKQAAFITRLRAERALPQTDTSGLSKAAASRLIDSLLATPRQAPAAPAAEPKDAAPGYYVTADDTLYVVVENKAHTHTYAKRLVITQGPARSTARWEYEAGAGRALAASDHEPLSVEKAASLGHLHGFCVICCRPLTDPESVTRGIGPVCASRLR